jgi:hypothetical protein
VENIFSSLVIQLPSFLTILSEQKPLKFNDHGKNCFSSKSITIITFVVIKSHQQHNMGIDGEESINHFTENRFPKLFAVFFLSWPNIAGMYFTSQWRNSVCQIGQNKFLLLDFISHFRALVRNPVKYFVPIRMLYSCDAVNFAKGHDYALFKNGSASSSHHLYFQNYPE